MDIKHCIDHLKATRTDLSGCPNDIISPEHSQSTFLLVMQTKGQQVLMKEYGNIITLMDGIYRTTKYGFPCFFLTVKTSLGLGRVVATIIPQYKSEELLAEGLAILKEWNPKWSPCHTMTDKSSVEKNLVQLVRYTQIPSDYYVTFTEAKHGSVG